MHKLFNNILIPFNFSAASERTVEKAIALANTFQCNIHLLYTDSSLFPKQAIKKLFGLNSSSLKSGNTKRANKLKILAQKYQDQLSDGLKVFSSFEKGNRNDIAVNYILHHKIDVVLATVFTRKMKRNKLRLDVNRIAGKTAAAVITVPEERRISHLYSIVIPVTDFIPLRKLMYGIYLARFYKTTIHLLGITHKQDQDYSQRVGKYLHRSYQLIRDNCDVPIEMTRRDGYNVAEAVKDYTIDNDTDLVIVNPGRQSRFKRFSLDRITGILQNIYPPVLTIGTS